MQKPDRNKLGNPDPIAGRALANFEEAWTDAIAEWEAAYWAYVKVHHTGDERRLALTSRQFWKATADVLLLHNRNGNWLRGDLQDQETGAHISDPNRPPRFGLPRKIAELLATQAGYLCVGEIPELAQHATSRGRTSAGPHEARWIESAVGYMIAAREGLIDDPHATKSVSEAFGVSRKTAQAWRRRLTLGANTSIDDVRPGRFGRPDALAARMKAAGAAYRQAGRSEKALKHRSQQTDRPPK